MPHNSLIDAHRMGADAIRPESPILKDCGTRPHFSARGQYRSFLGRGAQRAGVDEPPLDSNGIRKAARLGLLVALVYVGLACVCAWPVYADGDFEKGLRAARSGELQEAVHAWDRVLRRRPNNYAATVNRGTALMMKGFVFRGVTDWHKAWALAPPLAYGYYTVDFIDEGRGESPLISYVVSLEIDPDYTASIILTAAALIELGRSAMASDLFRKSMVLTKNPLLKNRFHHWAKSIEGDPARRQLEADSPE